MLKKSFLLFPVLLLVAFLALGCGSGGGTGTTTTTSTTTTVPLTAYHFSGSFLKNACTYDAMVVILVDADVPLGGSSVSPYSSPYVTYETISFSSGTADFDISTTATGEYYILGIAPFVGGAPDYIGGYEITTGEMVVALSQLITLEATGAYSRFSLGNMNLYLMTGDD